MSTVTLYIGSKKLSSWSLRPWLLLRHHNVSFAEQLIELDRPDTHERILAHSPSGRVPLLVDGTIRVWESLAICEYAAERYALRHAWPADLAPRGLARAYATEMHGGFAALRRNMPFNATRDPSAMSIDPETQADIERICAIWREARQQHGGPGPWLFGEFGIVDAMFAPVALRFEAYAVKLGRLERAYVQTVLNHKAVQQWIEGAAMEAPAATRPKPAAPGGQAAPVSTPATSTATRETPRVRSVILPAD